VKRTCRRKIAFPNEEAARMAARAMHERDGGRMVVYRCSVGLKGEPRHWHVGRA
jgi:hypothetical protein